MVKILKFVNFNESIEFDYLHQLYINGSITQKVYDKVKNLNLNHLKVGDVYNQKINLLNYLSKFGYISDTNRDLEHWNLNL